MNHPPHRFAGGGIKKQRDQIQGLARWVREGAKTLY
jgi:hypothetical protein